MKEIRFNSKGGAIVASAKFTHAYIMQAKYEIMLHEHDSNASTLLKKGDNLNMEDDIAFLPFPPAINNGKRVVLETGFVGNDYEHYPSYDIVLEIYQDGKLIGYERESGLLTGKGQYSLLFVRLVGEQS